MHFPILTTVTLLLTLTTAIPLLPRGEAAANAVVVTEPGKSPYKPNRRHEAAANAVVVTEPGKAPYKENRRHEAATNAIPPPEKEHRRSGYRRHEAAANAVTVGPCYKITKARDLEGRLVPVNCTNYKRGEAAANAVTVPWDECQTFVKARALPICNF